jgi:hypothetical protein
MSLSRRIGMLLAGLLAVSATPGLALAKSKSSSTAKLTAKSIHALLTSRELWGTIDVCSPTDQPNTVGIRGSMPGDGHAGDKMYMSFRLQYLSATQQWVDLASGATPSFVTVGAAAAVREGGRSFQLVPVAGKPASKLRGVVDFQWRRGKTILLSAARPTTAEHVALAGADPAGYSAASCLIG